jgi:hypothetical protein
VVVQQACRVLVVLEQMASEVQGPLHLASESLQGARLAAVEQRQLHRQQAQHGPELMAS